MTKRIAVIGAGPAGSYFAYLMAKSGHEVDLYEDNEEVGVPMQCTGIVTRTLLEMVTLPKRLIFNELKYVKVFAPDGTSIRVKNSDIVIDRIGFDKYLAEIAVKAGAKLHLRHRFVRLVGEAIVLQTPHGEKTIFADYLIGADGPNSAVAKAAGIFGKREYYIGAQTRMEKPGSKSLGLRPSLRRTKDGKKLESDVQRSEVNDLLPSSKQSIFDKETYEVHLDVPQFFGWSVPENEKVSRVGIGTFKVPNKYFNEIIDKYGKENNKIGNQGGLIPVYNPKLKNQKKIGQLKIFLAGDAATFVKATTGGGIVQAMQGAQILHDHIVHKKSYKLHLLKLHKDLWLHLQIRDVLNKFKDEEYNELVRLLATPKAKKILEQESRDKPLRFILKLFTAQPRLLRFFPISLRKNMSGMKNFEKVVATNSCEKR